MKSKIQQALDNNKPYGRSWEDFLLPDQMEFLYKAFEQFASQPPSGNLWEHVDAVKDPPLEGIYFVHAPGWQKMCRASFEFGKWIDRDFDINGYYEKDITEHVISYLRPVTGQRYSEEDIDNAVDFGFRQHDKNGYISVPEQTQFIQSLNKKQQL